MSGNDSEDPNSSSIPESTTTDLQLDSLGGTVGTAAAQRYVILNVSTISGAQCLIFLIIRRPLGHQKSDAQGFLEEHGDESLADSDAIRPPLGVKLTAYRLVNMATIFIFCFVKGILSLEGGLSTTAVTASDLISGGVLGSVLYCIGLYEAPGSKKWEWFLQVDLAPKIGNGAKRVVGEAMWPLFFFDGLLVVISLGNFLGNVAVLLFVISVPHIPRGAPWGIYIGVFVCVHVLWYSVVALVCVIASTR
ncbi:hypothetical protein V8E53_006213 [Lactarius tabidus]